MLILMDGLINTADILILVAAGAGIRGEVIEGRARGRLWIKLE